MKREYLSKLKEATKGLTSWESSKKAFGHYKVLQGVVTPEKKVDRLYEFWCLLKILDDIRKNYSVTCISATRSNGKIFPQAPALKKGWAYFEITNIKDKENKFQVCYGTKIKLSKTPKTTIAPDISVQDFNATDDPDEKVVELIMDAKYKYDKNTKIPVNEVHAFIQRVNALDTQNACSLNLQFSSLSKIKSNCLITNGKALKDQDDYCRQYRIKQVENFDINSIPNTIG